MSKQEWWDKKFRKNNRYQKHHKGRNYHHLIPRSRGGENSSDNLLLIEIEKHEAWHKIFGTKTAEEALRLLERVVQAKKAQALVEVTPIRRVA
jgi:5-methylcytosine-specific restriction endonuclease McrA